MGFSDIPIRDAFLSLFTALFSNYRKYLLPIDDSTRPRHSSPGDMDMTLHFDKSAFLNENKSSRDFLSHMMDTQLFAKFVSDRSTTNNVDADEIIFFDESIIDKTKSTFITTRKKSTPLLDDTSHQIKDTFVVPAPNTIGLESAQHIRYERFPSRMRIENFGPARSATFLINVSDKVKAHGSSLRATYKHDKQSSLAPSGSFRGTSKNLRDKDDNVEVSNASSLRDTLSFIGMTLDHIILLSIAEVRRRQLQQQAILVEKLKQHIVQNKVVDASNSGTVSDYPSTRSRSKSSIVFRDNGDISIDEVDGSRTTFSANKIVSLSPDYAKTTSAHTIRLDGRNLKFYCA